MSPRIDGSLPSGYLWAYMPEFRGHRRMSFLAFKVMLAELPGRNNRPRLGTKHLRLRTEAERWERVHAQFAKWQGQMERREK